jgi:hypothetical protein
MEAYNEQEVVTTEVVNEQAAFEVKKLADSAFGKCLAAVILAWWPICSVIAIILGGIGLKAAKQATELAEANKIQAGGKNIAAKITGKIGLIGGIIMTVFWLFYIILIVAMIGLTASMY